MEVKQYDAVLLKDGREASIVEKFSDTDFLADIGDSPKDWETISISLVDIECVLPLSDTRQTSMEDAPP